MNKKLIVKLSRINCRVPQNVHTKSFSVIYTKSAMARPWAQKCVTSINPSENIASHTHIITYVQQVGQGGMKINNVFSL